MKNPRGLSKLALVTGAMALGACGGDDPDGFSAKADVAPLKIFTASRMGVDVPTAIELDGELDRREWGRASQKVSGRVRKELGTGISITTIVTDPEALWKREPAQNAEYNALLALAAVGNPANNVGHSMAFLFEDFLSDRHEKCFDFVDGNPGPAWLIFDPNVLNPDRNPEAPSLDSMPDSWRDFPWAEAGWLQRAAECVQLDPRFKPSFKEGEQAFLSMVDQSDTYAMDRLGCALDTTNPYVGTRAYHDVLALVRPWGRSLSNTAILRRLVQAEVDTHYSNVFTVDNPFPMDEQLWEVKTRFLDLQKTEGDPTDRESMERVKWISFRARNTYQVSTRPVLHPALLTVLDRMLEDAAPIMLGGPIELRAPSPGEGPVWGAPTNP